jgi:hypothetical protein
MRVRVGRRWCRWCRGNRPTLWGRILAQSWLLLPAWNCIWWMCQRRDRAWTCRCVWPGARGNVRRWDRTATLRGWWRGTCLYTTGSSGRRCRWGLTASRIHRISRALSWPGIREGRRNSRGFTRRPARRASLSDRWRIIPAAVLAALGWWRWGCNRWRSSPWATEWQASRGCDMAAVLLLGALAVGVS